MNLCPVVFQLPRHKSVVVSLRDSDDSDSDVDACSSSQAAFGGLEFMIKEARRTVEVSLQQGPKVRIILISHCNVSQLASF